MPPRVQPPPFNVPLFDKNGRMALAWEEWFNTASTQIATGSAPADAQFFVATGNPFLTNERNLGALASGYLKIAVALGVATPSSSATIPTTDLAGTLQAAQEPAHTGDVTNAAGSLALAIGAHKVLQTMLEQIASGTVLGRLTAGLGDVSAINIADLTPLTGAFVKHGTKTITFADTPYSVAATDEVVLVDATGGAVTVNLPTPASGREVAVKKTDASGNAVTVSAGAHNIDAAGTKVLAAQWNSVLVDSDGTNYFILAQV